MQTIATWRRKAKEFDNELWSLKIELQWYKQALKDPELSREAVKDLLEILEIAQRNRVELARAYATEIGVLV